MYRKLRMNAIRCNDKGLEESFNLILAFSLKRLEINLFF